MKEFSSLATVLIESQNKQFSETQRNTENELKRQHPNGICHVCARRRVVQEVKKLFISLTCKTSTKKKEKQ